MPQLLVRDLDGETIEKLKQLAKRHNRSLQGEVKQILEEAVLASGKMTLEESRVVAERWQKYLAGKPAIDSTELIREDRER